MAHDLSTALDSIARDNDLTTVSFSKHPFVDHSKWTVALHWDGFSQSGISCVHGHGDSYNEALTKALAAMRADRDPVTNTAAISMELAA